MYISKMIFMETKEIDYEVYQLMQEYGIVQFTDYETTEILSSAIQEQMLSYYEDKELKEKLDLIRDTIGHDVFDMLKNNELDFVLLI